VILAIMILPSSPRYPRGDDRGAVFAARGSAGVGRHALGDDLLGVLRNARIGIVGAIILGLGRALGETMAVTMVSAILRRFTARCCPTAARWLP